MARGWLWHSLALILRAEEVNGSPAALPPLPHLLFPIPDSSIMQEGKIRLGVAASFLKIGALLPVLKPYLRQFEDTRCCAASEAFRNDWRMK